MSKPTFFKTAANAAKKIVEQNPALLTLLQSGAGLATGLGGGFFANRLINGPNPQSPQPNSTPTTPQSQG